MPLGHSDVASPYINGVGSDTAVVNLVTSHPILELLLVCWDIT